MNEPNDVESDTPPAKPEFPILDEATARQQLAEGLVTLEEDIARLDEARRVTHKILRMEFVV